MTTTHSISIQGSEQSTACAEGQTLLDSFLRNGVWVPNSCNQGTCGTCKVRVHKGAVDHHASPEHTLPIQEREQGLALACQATPIEDTVVEPTHQSADGAKHFHPLRDFEGVVVGLEEMARDTKRVRIALEEPIEYSPGQYVELKVPGTDQYRHYSLANSSGHDTEIELHVKRQSGGLASDAWIFRSMTLGDRVELKGPLGDFVCADTQTDGGVIMLAGGTGMAPIKGILQRMLEDQPDREIHLYHSVRSEVDLYDTDYFEGLSDRHPHFHWKPCLTDQEWDGRVGYPSELVPQEFTTLKGWSGYLCGPPAMVDAGKRAFKRRRMSPRRIHREKYTVSSPIAETEHPQSEPKIPITPPAQAASLAAATS